MGKKELMLIGIKESFMVRALENKLKEADIAFFFVHPDIDEANKQLPRASAIAYYIDQSEIIPKSFLHFIDEHLREKDEQIILIGEHNDIIEATKNLSLGRVYKEFERPLNTELFIKAVLEMFNDTIKHDKKSILIVDDDANYIGLIREWLREKYKVCMAVSGMQAISLLATTHVDLILLDYEMPITSGPQVLEMLRSDMVTRNIPVIFLTGKNDRDSVVRVMDLHPDGYLLKSIERGELMAEIEKFFYKRKMQ